MDNADWVFADSAPVAWLQRRVSGKDAKVIPGYKIMLAICDRAAQAWRKGGLSGFDTGCHESTGQQSRLLVSMAYPWLINTARRLCRENWYQVEEELQALQGLRHPLAVRRPGLPQAGKMDKYLWQRTGLSCARRRCRIRLAIRNGQKATRLDGTVRSRVGLPLIEQPA